MVTAIAAHRLFLAATTDFVINDGGLFYAFVNAVADVFPGLPSHASYNGLSIPFAYPPLSFWIGALLTRLGADPLAVVHLLPIGMNLIYVLLFALLLRRNAVSPLAIAITLLFLSTNQRSFEWLVMGGGLSRGLGSIFLMLALLAVRLPTPHERFTLPARRLMLAGAAVGGAILSHLEWGIDAAAAVVLSRALASPNLREFIRSCITAGVTALLVILPWLLFVVQQHGLGPLQAAAGSSRWELSGYWERALWLLRTSLANLLIPIGLILLVRRRNPFWPLFLLMCILLTPRHAYTPAALALAVFAAGGALWIAGRIGNLLTSKAIATALAALLILILAAAPLDRNLIAKGYFLRPLNADEREAMDWVARHHRGQTFLVLTGLPWWSDRSAEWFPVLTGAHSVNTLQGREWLPGNAYARWFDGDQKMKKSQDCAALLKNIGAFESVRYIWVQWRDRCFSGSGFRPVYRNAAVTIYQFMPGSLLKAQHSEGSGRPRG